MNKRLLLAVAVLFTTLPALSQFCASAPARSFYNRAINSTNPQHLQFFHTLASDIRSGKTAATEVESEVRRYTSRSSFSTMDIDAMVFIILMEASQNAEEDLRNAMEKIKELNEKKRDQREAIALLRKRKSELANKTRNEYLSRTEFDSLRQKLATATLIKSVPVAIPAADTLRRSLDNKKLISNGAVQRVEPSKFAISSADFAALTDGYRDKIDALNEISEQESMRMQRLMDRLNSYYSLLSNLFQKISTAQDSIIDNLK